MAAEEQKGRASKERSRAAEAAEKEPCVLLGQRLGEAGRFAYAALCGVSLAWLFPEEEQRCYTGGAKEATWVELVSDLVWGLLWFAGQGRSFWHWVFFFVVLSFSLTNCIP